jgi:hypothetical protein
MILCVLVKTQKKNSTQQKYLKTKTQSAGDRALLVRNHGQRRADKNSPARPNRRHYHFP